MNAHPFLQQLYLLSGFIVVMGYGPQLRRLVLHPDAGAKACPLSSWLLWTACRVVALLYCSVAVGDAALALIVGLDVAGRAAVLVLLLRQRWRTGSGAGVRPAVWTLGALALLPLLLG